MKTLTMICLAVLLTVPAGAVELKLKWQPGKRYQFQQDQSSTMDMVVPGQAQAMAMRTEGIQLLGYTVSEHPKGTKVDMKIGRFKVTTSMGGQEMMSFDSENPDAQAGQLAAMLAPLMEATISTIYDTEGKVVEVQGLDDIAGLDQLGMGKEQLEGMAKHAELYLPGKNVEAGDTWSTEVDLPLGELAGQKAKILYDLKFEGIEERGERTLARISLKGKLDMAEGDEVVLKMDAKDLSGTILFDIDLGQPVETNLSMDMVMGLPPGMPKAEGAPGEIPMKTVTVQKLVKVEDAR